MLHTYHYLKLFCFELYIHFYLKLLFIYLSIVKAYFQVTGAKSSACHIEESQYIFIKSITDG